MIFSCNLKLAPKYLLNRLIGRGPFAVQPFDQLFPTPDNVHNHVLAAVAGDSCPSTASTTLLSQQPATESLPGVSRSPARRLFSVSDACLAGGDGVVYCPRRRLAVAETVRLWLQPADAHPLLSAPGIPSAQPLLGRTLSLASLGAEGFYHFLIESLPRLELARPWLAGLDHVLAPGRPGGFQEQWLALAGVPREKIIWLEGLSHYRCEQLLFTSALSEDSEPTPWLVEAIRRAVGFVPATRATRHLWISRRDAAARNLTWEDALLARLPQFECVELASRPPAEQIALLREAAVVAGPHGAGLANLVFCPPGAAIIELHPDRDRPVFARLATAAGCRHAWAAVDFKRAPENLTSLAGAIRDFAA